LKTAVIRLYEGMFLVDSGKAASDWEKMLATIKNVLNRAGAEVVSIEKWDERNLTYEINKQTRGTYILSYFKADSSRVKEIERYSRLSEEIMRVLILGTEKMKMSDIKKPTPAMIAEEKIKQAEAAKSESPEETQQPDETVKPVAESSENEPETSENREDDTDVNDKAESEKTEPAASEPEESKSEESEK